MFEGSESGEVEGGSTESTVVSSISACKRVRAENSVSCAWIRASPRLSVCLLIKISVFSPLGRICLSVDLCLFASSCARDINFLPLGASDALRLCNKSNSRVLTSLLEIYPHPLKESETVLCSNSVLDSCEYWLKNEKTLCRLGLLDEDADTSCTLEARCGYVIILMTLYWCTECMPLAVTALLPVILFPMMGIMKAGDVQSLFTLIPPQDNHNLLHSHRLMIGFMIVSAFLSMWISNTATTAMMLPIAHAVLQQLQVTEARAEERDLQTAAEDNLGFELESKEEITDEQKPDTKLQLENGV
ncbi:hypothetical protein GOODEAATRI_010156, partial [Goodea atripinnis]